MLLDTKEVLILFQFVSFFFISQKRMNRFVHTDLYRAITCWKEFYLDKQRIIHSPENI